MKLYIFLIEDQNIIHIYQSRNIPTKYISKCDIKYTSYG